jgi:type II secretory pathway component PulF
MILTFEAVDQQGRRSSDSMEATCVSEAVEALRSRGLFVTGIKEDQKATDARTSSGAAIRSSARLPLRVLALFTRQMAMLLRAGSGLVPAIQSIARQMKPHHAALLDQVVTDLENGTTLTDALRKHPKTFDTIYCAIIAAGEASASLPQMFARLADMVGKQRNVRNKLIGAMAYPALLVLLCVKIIFVLLFFVLPRFAGMFQQLGVPTPTVTRWLLMTGDFLRQRWPWVLAAAMVLGGSAVCFFLGRIGRRWLGEVQFALPVLGRLRSRLMQAHILQTMGLLLESRVGVLDTLALVRTSCTAKPFARLFEALDQAVTSGGALSTAFMESQLLEPYLCQAIRTGEDSGNLGEAMTYSAEVLNESNAEMLNVIAKLLEPLILITMGVVVGGVAVSLFLPLFDLTSALK